MQSTCHGILQILPNTVNLKKTGCAIQQGLCTSRGVLSRRNFPGHGRPLVSICDCLNSKKLAISQQEHACIEEPLLIFFFHVATGPQPLRGIPGNVFQNQQTNGLRSVAIGGLGRLQNAKLGSATLFMKYPRNTQGWS